MSGLGSTLSIAKTAIISQQYGLAVTGNNIANVNNPNYSLQNADQVNRGSALYAGYLFGTGVDTSQIEQNVDLLLENRLNDEKSAQSAYAEMESYMDILEGYFDTNSTSSITNTLTEFWNSWYDLSNNPLGSAERVAVYDQGDTLADRLNDTRDNIDSMVTDINQEITVALGQINAYTAQIADLNKKITGMEGNQPANDLRDQRNGLLDDLAALMDIDKFEQPSGAVIVNASNGLTLVNGVDNYQLYEQEDQVLWTRSSGAGQDITGTISGGKLAGWLELRDSILPKVASELDVLTHELIWAMNYEHTQGSGLEYFTEPLTGDYSTDQSGLLSGYSFGSKIDYTDSFVVWMQDKTTVDTQYTQTSIDMNLSEAKVSAWQGNAPGHDQYRYQLTVMDSATLGDKQVIQTDGGNLAEVSSSDTSVADALDGALAGQILTINDGPSGTEVIHIKDVGGDAQRSARSIAEALSAIEGVDAYASALSADFDVTGIAAAEGGDAEDGDAVQFTLYVEGLVYEQRFTVDSEQGTLADQFENALREAAQGINTINSDLDLYTDGLKITSSSGRTLGIQDFEVIDNAGVSIDTFSGFDAGETVSFTLSGSTTTAISIVLPDDMDTGDEVQMAAAFYDAMRLALEDEPFTVDLDPSTNSIVLRTTDGSDLTVSNGDNTAGAGANFNITVLSSTTQSAGNSTFLFDGAGTDTAVFDADTSDADILAFSGTGIEEKTAGGVSAGVITGSITIVTDPGMSIHSSVAGAGGLFADNWAKSGSSILTLGGEGGFSDFTIDDTLFFDVDGTNITYTIAGTTDLERATELADALDAALGTEYEIFQTGSSVSILKNISSDVPIEITDFEATLLGVVNTDTALAVTTGTGSGTSDPENDLLVSGNDYRNFATASLYADEGIIKWKKYDANGLFTGEAGLITVEEQGTIFIVEAGATTLSFDIAPGSLVAGNTLTVNTDDTGQADPLNFTISGSANVQNEIYQFTVKTGGKVGELVTDEQDTITIEWKTGTGSGIIELEGSDPPQTPDSPIEVEVDGMILKFYDGSLFENDVFTITTDASGMPVSFNENGNATGELLSDWHWTIDSFAGQFNRQTEGLTASTTEDNRLVFEASDTYVAVTNVEYSGSNGFNPENVNVRVTDWSAMDFTGDDLQFVRSSGGWGLVNDPTGGRALFIPEGGDDDGFGVDFNGDGLADIQIEFARKISGDGSVRFDLDSRNKNDISFAFSDDSGASSGLLAAAGINTFFKGQDASTIEINQRLADTDYIAAAKIDSETGQISQGDNANALALGDIQYQNITMKQWTYDRTANASSNLTTTTLNGYFSTMTGSIGVISGSIKTSREFADIMVNNLTEQRNAVSAVSLDEEMIKLMEYQNAYSAASKLLTIVDEMMQTLINVI